MERTFARQRCIRCIFWPMVNGLTQMLPLAKGVSVEGFIVTSTIACRRWSADCGRGGNYGRDDVAGIAMAFIIFVAGWSECTVGKR